MTMAITMRFFDTKFFWFVFFLVWTISGHAQIAVEEFEARLNRVDCDQVSQRKSFNLRVLGRNFPMSSEYDFYGLDRGDAVFVSEPTLELNEKPAASDINKSIRRKWELTSHVYYSSENIEKPDGFASINNWRGMSIFYKEIDSGNEFKRITYQVLVRDKSKKGSLRFTAGSPQLISDIVACAEVLPGR